MLRRILLIKKECCTIFLQICYCKHCYEALGIGQNISILLFLTESLQIYDLNQLGKKIGIMMSQSLLNRDFSDVSSQQEQWLGIQKYPNL